ncbi:MAG: hypothetical protein BGO16_00150 [Nitrobacter sp. 62-23]|nr:MAG: hypothetical protein BGO16_00150 [Nitrobacter sp. 62-23]
MLAIPVVVCETYQQQDYSNTDSPADRDFVDAIHMFALLGDRSFGNIIGDHSLQSPLPQYDCGMSGHQAWDILRR